MKTLLMREPEGQLFQHNNELYIILKKNRKNQTVRCRRLTNKTPGAKESVKDLPMSEKVERVTDSEVNIDF